MKDLPTNCLFYFIINANMKKIELLIFGALLMGLASADPEELEIHAMSFNIRLGVAEDGPNHWDLRKELVFDVFRDHQPDVVGVQEAWKIQIDALKAAFPEFGMIGRSRQADPGKGEWCPILYRKEKFEH